MRSPDPYSNFDRVFAVAFVLMVLGGLTLVACTWYGLSALVEWLAR